MRRATLTWNGLELEVEFVWDDDGLELRHVLLGNVTDTSEWLDWIYLEAHPREWLLLAVAPSAGPLEDPFEPQRREVREEILAVYAIEINDFVEGSTDELAAAMRDGAEREGHEAAYLDRKDP